MENKNRKKRYELIQKIGSGSFGRVYKAKDLKCSKIVAIKIFSIKKKKKRNRISIK